MTIKKNSAIKDLYSPLFPNRAKSGTKCNYEIIRETDDGHILLTFKKTEKNAWFNITAGGQSWKFDGSEGFHFLATPHKHVWVKYKAPGQGRNYYEEHTAFLIEAKWNEGSTDGMLS